MRKEWQDDLWILAGAASEARLFTRRAQIQEREIRRDTQAAETKTRKKEEGKIYVEMIKTIQKRRAKSRMQKKLNK